jgi:hypothetical protein
MVVNFSFTPLTFREKDSVSFVCYFLGESKFASAIDSCVRTNSTRESFLPAGVLLPSGYDIPLAVPLLPPLDK